jgi:hypothetical protein
MRKLKEIWRAYQEVNTFLLQKEGAARSETTRAQWERRRDMNDHAYFVVLFACFDDHVITLCSDVVTKKRSLRSWRQRRLWDTVDVDAIERMPFKRRLALLLDKGNAGYRDANELYAIRNRIAHGTTAQIGPMNVALHYQDIARLWGALRP